MPVRFDDSLKLLVRIIVAELGEAVILNGVALRDAKGRLAFFASQNLDASTIERVSRRLLTELGSYARTDRILAGSGDFGVVELLSDPLMLSVNVDGRQVRLVDRRLVGADWLRTPSPPAPPPPRFVFSSIKGGVGRSTALCVAAADLATHGRRVLAIDLDMEAPGLGAILLNEGTLPKFGLIDALVENGLSGLDEEFFADLVGPSALADHHGQIDVIPAFGRNSMENPGDILSKIARAYTEDVRPDGTVASILDQVRSLVDRFASPKRYDAVLIDARAGLHETSASAILGLGAYVFLFGLDDSQTFHGYAALLAHISRLIRPPDQVQEWLERVTVVQGKAPADTAERDEFAEKCRELFATANLGIPDRFAKKIELHAPAGPFNDVPWDDDIGDDDVLTDDSLRQPDVIAILDDPRFRRFEPVARRDLISERIYRSSYGQFIDRINQTLGTG